MSFPSKQEREKCWASRDLFWKCLDEAPGGETPAQVQCAKFREMYESTCPSQWVSVQSDILFYVQRSEIDNLQVYF